MEFGYVFRELSEGDYRFEYRGVSVGFSFLPKVSPHSFEKSFVQFYAEGGAISGEGNGQRIQTLEGEVAGFRRFQRLGVQWEFRSGVVLADDRTALHREEKLRVGGRQSVRGYGEEEFSFSAMAIARSELRYFLSERTFFYILADGGAGVRDEWRRKGLQGLFAFGGGLSYPVGAYRLKVEVAKQRGTPFRESLLMVTVSQ